MIFPISIFFCVFCIYCLYRSGRNLVGIKIVILTWAFELLLLALPIFDFDVRYSLGADLYCASALVAISLGYFFSARKLNFSKSALEIVLLSKGMIRISFFLSLIGIVGQSLLLFDARSRGIDLDIASLFLNLNDVRQQVFDDLDANKTISAIAVVGGYLASGSLLSLISLAYFVKNMKHYSTMLKLSVKVQLVMGVINLVLLSAVSLFAFGARASIAYALLIILVASLLVNIRILKVTGKRIILVLALLYSTIFFAVEFTSARNSSSIDPEAVLYDIHRAKYSELIAPFAKDNESVGLFLLTLSYFAEPLPTLAFYIEREMTPGPFWGQYSFPFFARVINRATGSFSNSDWVDIRKKVFIPLESAGYYGNVWSTWLRDLLIDFSYVGAVLFCFFYGNLLAKVGIKFAMTGKIFYLWIEVLGVFIAAFGAFANLLWNGGLFNPLLISFALLISSRVTLTAGGTRERKP